MPLGAWIDHILERYPVERQESLTDNPLAAQLRGTFPEEVRRFVGESWLVDGSPGQGNWAATPWLAVFEPTITNTAQRGFYLVYLFRGDGSECWLSLNQGTTEVYDRVGGRHYLQVLRDQAAVDRGLLGSAVAGLELGQLDLGEGGRLTKGYAAGNIAATRYARNVVPPEAQVRADLTSYLELYRRLVEAREAVGEGVGEELPPGVSPGEEARKYRWHRRAERNSKLARDAKRYHGYTCQACGFNFRNKYGNLAKEYVEAHHLVPFAALAARPEVAVLDPRSDFVVLCANCHRVAHMKDGPTFEQLRDHFVIPRA